MIFRFKRLSTLNLRLKAKFCTSEDAAKAARKKRAAMGGKAPSNQSSSNYDYLNNFLGFGVVAVCGYIVYDIKNNKKGLFGSMYYDSFIDKSIQWVYSKLFTNMLEPANDKLLPDFVSGPFYGEIPPGTPPPPLLVVDLERTLIGSVHDSTHGWRHVKRPGADKFIEQLKQYYEIVIFSENDRGVAQEIMDAVGGEAVHKFGSTEAELRGDDVIKRLDYMNRPIERIILIDDDTVTADMFPRNTLLIKPFTNINDSTDRALYELIPFLQGLVHEGIEDYRTVFDELGTHDCHEIATEYKMRVVKKKTTDYEKRMKGLGRLVLQDSKKFFSSLNKEENYGIPSPTEIVGSAPYTASSFNGEDSKDTPIPRHIILDTPVSKYGPPPRPKETAEKKKGGLFKLLDQIEQDKIIYENNKAEELHRQHMKKIEEKKLREQQKEIDLENQRMKEAAIAMENNTMSQ